MDKYNKNILDNDLSEEQNIAEFNKECSKYTYLPAILDKVRRIIAIGDIHGDLRLAKECFRIANLIDDADNWIGGDTHVVQVGDQLDNCRPMTHKCSDRENITNKIIKNISDISDNKLLAEDIKVLYFFTEMDEKARKDGGRVISIIGNHELMNIDGNFNYVSLNDIEKFKNFDGKSYRDGLSGRKHAFTPGNTLAKYIGCTRTSSVIIGNFLFTHAGIISEYANKIKSRRNLHKINYYVRKWVLGLINKEYITDIVSSTNNNGKLNRSLFWERILGSIPKGMNNQDDECEKLLKDTLTVFNIKGLVIGHTPQSFSSNNGINSICNNTVWRVDVGASVGFDIFEDSYNKKIKNMKELRKAQVLEILNDKEINIIS